MRNLLPLMLILAACGGDDNANTDAAAAKLDCATYCSQIMTNCTGANAQYPDAAHCMGTCATFTKGTVDDKTGNTLGCRIYHSGAPSMMTPGTHCFHAGPGGAGADGTTAQCGGDCDGFCSLVMATCPGKYADLATCTAACGGFASKPPFSTASTSGNNRQCRLYHATNAAATGNTADMVTLHCGHATAAGDQAPCMGQ